MLERRNKLHQKATDFYDAMAAKYNYTPYHRYFQEDYLYSDDILIHLDVFEYDRKAPTIIMVPGTALHSLCYVEVMYKIAIQGYNFIGIDPRGHGRSGGIKGDYSISEIMRDTERAIEYAKRRFNDSVSIMGSSQGGIVAFYLASQHHDIQSVICQNFAHLPNDQTMNLTRFPSLSKTIKPVLLNFNNKFFSETQVPITFYLELEKIKIRRLGSALDYIQADPIALKTISLRALSSLAHTELDCEMEEIKTPVYVFQGSEDEIFPLEYTKELYQRLNCKKHLEVFQGMNHALLTNNTVEVIPPIIKWLQEIYPSNKKIKQTKPANKPNP